ncbi:tyrosine kinase, partial [Rhizoctonia solani AG-3 Rhs1AP]
MTQIKHVCNELEKLGVDLHSMNQKIDIMSQKVEGIEESLEVVKLLVPECDHTLPFYGIGMDSYINCLHLYMVSPLMQNCNAVTYLERKRNEPGMKANILQIATDAAMGLQYLHGLNPLVVHSGMEGSNILITDHDRDCPPIDWLITAGTLQLPPLDDDRICSKILIRLDPLDPMGGGVARIGHGAWIVLFATGSPKDSQWLAPEMIQEVAVPLETAMDVWGWAMATLEVSFQT